MRHLVPISSRRQLQDTLMELAEKALEDAIAPQRTLSPILMRMAQQPGIPEPPGNPPPGPEPEIPPPLEEPPQPVPPPQPYDDPPPPQESAGCADIRSQSPKIGGRSAQGVGTSG